MTAGLTPRRRRKVMKPLIDPGWTIHETWRANGRVLEKDVEVSISGVKGRFRFQRAVEGKDGKVWIDVVGGHRGRVAVRSFSPDRVKTVHRLRKTEKNILADRSKTS
jgi:hypothetical protein